MTFTLGVTMRELESALGVDSPPRPFRAMRKPEASGEDLNGDGGAVPVHRPEVEAAAKTGKKKRVTFKTLEKNSMEQTIEEIHIQHLHGYRGDLHAAALRKIEETKKVVDAIARLAAKELTAGRKFTLPGLVSLTVAGKEATEAGRKMVFGKELRVAAKPAKKVVKASPVGMLKKAFESRCWPDASRMLATFGPGGFPGDRSSSVEQIKPAIHSSDQSSIAPQQRSTTAA
jgi:nucleoid DNA-binding protein